MASCGLAIHLFGTMVYDLPPPPPTLRDVDIQVGLREMAAHHSSAMQVSSPFRGIAHGVPWPFSPHFGELASETPPPSLTPREINIQEGLRKLAVYRVSENRGNCYGQALENWRRTHHDSGHDSDLLTDPGNSVKPTEDSDFSNHEQMVENVKKDMARYFPEDKFKAVTRDCSPNGIRAIKKLLTKKEGAFALLDYDNESLKDAIVKGEFKLSTLSGRNFAFRQNDYHFLYCHDGKIKQKFMNSEEIDANLEPFAGDRWLLLSKGRVVLKDSATNQHAIFEEAMFIKGVTVFYKVSGEE